MTQYIALVRVYLLDLLLSTFASKATGKKKTRQTSGWVVLLILCGLMLYVSGLYSYMLAQMLVPLGALNSLPTLMLFFGLFFCCTLTLYLAQSLLFSQKDGGQVFSFPVSSLCILLARLTALYLEVLFLMEMFLLPLGVVYLLFANPAPLYFIPLLLLLGVLLSFIPTLISLLFGLFITLVISKTPFKKIFTILIGLLIPLSMMAISFTLSSSYAESDAILALSVRLDEMIPLLRWAVAACTQGNFLSLLQVAAFCLLPFLGVVLLISRFYKRLLTGLLHVRKRGHFSLHRMSTRIPFWALFSKEARRFFSTPGYLLNGGFGMLLLLVSSILSLVFQDDVRATLATVVTPLVQAGLADASTLAGLVLLVFLQFVSISFQPSCVCLSLEGNCLWLLKGAPVPVKSIFLAKISFPIACALACYLFALPMLGMALSLSALQLLSLFLLLIPCAVLSSILGFILNLKFPRLDALSDIVVIKQSLSVFLGLLFGFLQAFITTALYAVFTLLGFGFFSFLPAFIVLAAFCVFSAFWLKYKGTVLFGALA